MPSYKRSNSTTGTTIDGSDSGTDNESTDGTEESSSDDAGENATVGDENANTTEDSSNNESTDTKVKHGDEPFDFIDDNSAADDAAFEALSAAALAETDVDNQQDSSGTSQIKVSLTPATCKSPTPATRILSPLTPRVGTST